MSSGFISRPQQHNYASALRLSFPFVSRNRQLTFALPSFLPSFYLPTSFHPSSMPLSLSLSLSSSLLPSSLCGCGRRTRTLGVLAIEKTTTSSAKRSLSWKNEKKKKRRKMQRRAAHYLGLLLYYIIYTYTRRPSPCLHSFFLDRSGKSYKMAHTLNVFSCDRNEVEVFRPPSLFFIEKFEFLAQISN